MIQIESAGLLPKIKPRTVIAPYEDIFLSDYIYTSPVVLSPAEKAAIRAQEERMREIARSKIMTLPFRQASYWTWRGFKTVQHILFKESLVYMQVKGKYATFKLDRNAGWALEDGRALDRLLQHRL